VEPENIIGLARESAAANGFSDHIEFFEKLSTEITLPEPATIIISDLRGVLPWFEQSVSSIIDARERLLAPGGALIPHRDVLWAAVVNAPEQYDEILKPWQNRDLDLSAGKRLVTNTWRKSRIKPEQLLTDAVCWSTLDYYEVSSPDVCAEISWQAARKGTAHGVAVWFDSELAEGIRFSNHPAAPEMIYGSGFFPFSRPAELMEGEHITVLLAADLVDDGYVWRWDTEVPGKASFKQSTFFGVPLSTSQLRNSVQ
jgi:protein arginine N-methyltransferase 1